MYAVAVAVSIPMEMPETRRATIRPEVALLAVNDPTVVLIWPAPVAPMPVAALRVARPVVERLLAAVTSLISPVVAVTLIGPLVLVSNASATLIPAP